jgi:hypothetical protein
MKVIVDVMQKPDLLVSLSSAAAGCTPRLSCDGEGKGRPHYSRPWVRPALFSTRFKTRMGGELERRAVLRYPGGCRAARARGRIPDNDDNGRRKAFAQLDRQLFEGPCRAIT